MKQKASKTKLELICRIWFRGFMRNFQEKTPTLHRSRMGENNFCVLYKFN